MYYINNNYVLKPIYNDEKECINDMLSFTHKKLERIQGKVFCGFSKHRCLKWWCHKREEVGIEATEELEG